MDLRLGSWDLGLFPMGLRLGSWDLGLFSMGLRLAPGTWVSSWD
jgi:hypothetical protein